MKHEDITSEAGSLVYRSVNWPLSQDTGLEPPNTKKMLIALAIMLGTVIAVNKVVLSKQERI